QARLSPKEVARAWEQILSNLRIITDAGWVHADLSPYNLLWWDARLWVIDLPQAVDMLQNPHGFEFLHRDVRNVCGWFNRHGMTVDPDEVYADLLSTL
ncbi:MAG: kinase 1, partial [Acidimicrobiaceae bacterium]